MSESTVPGREQIVLASEDIAGRRRDLLEPGVNYVTLWREHKSLAGLMELDPGAELPEHTHRASIHHVWVVAGSARVDGRRLTAGSYVHVPAGVPHGLEALEEGCTLFYLYLRSDSGGGSSS